MLLFCLVFPWTIFPVKCIVVKRNRPRAHDANWVMTYYLLVITYYNINYKYNMSE